MMGRWFLWTVAVLLMGAASASGVVLENATMRIEFADAEGGFAVTGVVNCAAGEVPCLDGATGGFWSMFFSRAGATGDCERVTLDHRSSSAARRIRRVDENTVIFIWEGLDLPGEPGAVDVRARVKLVGASAEWTLAAVNRSKTWTATESWYPILVRALRPGVDDALIPTMNLGAKFVRGYDPVKLRLRGFGSPSWYPMVTAIQRGRAGLYVAAHDGEMRIKSLVYLPDGTLQFQVPLERSAGPDPVGPKFKVVTQCYDGDWWDAARIYRAWAMRQKWTAKGPIAKRTDYPKALAEVAVWGRAIAEDENCCKMFRSAFPDVKVGLRWYCWENEKFDTCYPELTPRPKMKTLFKSARDSGILVMPYVNGRLWDRALASFPSVEADACHDEKDVVCPENYAADFAIMCPAVPRWQRKLLEIGTEVVDGLGANAVYYDQVNCAQWRTCFAAGHPHPFGGGDWWARGYREAFGPIKEKFASAGVPITSEGACEAWMDLVDGALIVGRAPEATDVPFYPAVYSGYTTYFCIEQEADDSPEALFARQVQNALWGCATGSWDDRRLFDPDPAKRTLAAQVAVIRRMAQLRSTFLDYLAYGHLLDELRPLDPVPVVTIAHRPTRGAKGAPSLTVDYPAVLGSVWRDVDGCRRATFAANVSDVPQTVRIRLARKGSRVRMRAIGNEPVPCPTVCEDSCSVSLEAKAVVCIEEDELK